MASIGSFFLVWWFENLFPAFPDVYGIFNNCLSEPYVWLVILLTVWWNQAWDMARTLYKFSKKEKLEKEFLEMKNRGDLDV